MKSAAGVLPAQRAPALLGQTVVVIGGSSGIGLETARRARADGAEVVLTGRNPDRLEKAALEIGALRTDAFDAADYARLRRFFDELPGRVDHLLVSGGGPYYGLLAEMDFEQARRNLDEPFALAVQPQLGMHRPLLEPQSARRSFNCTRYRNLLRICQS